MLKHDRSPCDDIYNAKDNDDNDDDNDMPTNVNGSFMICTFSIDPNWLK